MTKDELLAEADRVILVAEHRLGSVRTIAVLRAQACLAAASLKQGQVVGPHAPDAVPFVPGPLSWE